MRAWLSLSLASAGAERLLQGGHLPAQLQQLLVEQVDLGQRLVAESADLSASSLESAEMRASFSPPPPAMPPRRSLSVLSVAKLACRAASSSCERLALALLEAQQVGEFGDLAL